MVKKKKKSHKCSVITGKELFNSSADLMKQKRKTLSFFLVSCRGNTEIHQLFIKKMRFIDKLGRVRGEVVKMQYLAVAHQKIMQYLQINTRTISQNSTIGCRKNMQNSLFRHRKKKKNEKFTSQSWEEKNEKYFKGCFKIL